MMMIGGAHHHPAVGTDTFGRTVAPAIEAAEALQAAGAGPEKCTEAEGIGRVGEHADHVLAVGTHRGHPQVAVAGHPADSLQPHELGLRREQPVDVVQNGGFAHAMAGIFSISLSRVMG